MKKPSQTIHISHGHAQVNQPFVSLQRGIQSSIDVEKKVDSIEHNDLIEWITRHKKLFSADAWKFLKTNYFEKEDSAGLLISALGYFLGNGENDYFQNKSKQKVTLDNKHKKIFISELSQLPKKEMLITGKVRATSTSFKSQRPVCYIETTRLDFENGEHLSVFNATDYKLAEPDGTTAGLLGITQNEFKLTRIKK